MDNSITVNIADMKIAKGQETLVTYALGSCIGICLYDPIKKIGALGHIMLPISHTEEDEKLKRNRFANTCVPDMVESLVKSGCNRRTIIAKIAGGATMFKMVNSRNSSPTNSGLNNIGNQNILAVKDALKKFRINIVSEDIGADYARTVFFDTATGKVTIKSCSKPINII